ncbi:GNAT family N-acetyltransferase [Pseudalkalibacillus berkeleyi]|uniref:GNAT family N-acetyltransferase n=1 Tax=Pseudalkalibacillus berkeleyi TaxID=1069813 RepID=A0ABS9GW97_9BACL|nr:GNAT family N-acetyltransferase [Pseudalkalibacillus berkeleyi]MCF6136974.1 GNAT family N-acetyltransferase [Pseudalkalibacillus berkeleyi]
MEIRTIEESEFRDFLKMGEFAFQYKLSEEAISKRKTFMRLNDCWALFENGEMASKLTIHPMEIWLGGKVMPMGGIAGVATWPEQRRKGFVKALMKKALEQMKIKGQYVSMLHPFSFSFYRKYGWEMTHTTIKYEIKTDQLPRLSSQSNGSIERIKKESDRLDQIYNRMACKYSGMLKRTDDWWHYSILDNESDMIAVYKDGDGVDQGYMIYKVKENHMVIDEWVSLTNEAKLNMLDFVSKHDSMMNKITIHAPVDESFAFLMADPKINQEVNSYFMSRIVDVKSFLEEYPFKVEKLNQPIILQVVDSFAEWNNGIFIIRIDEGGGHKVDYHPLKEHATCSHEPSNVIQCDINTLSTMFFNYMRPSDLALQGNLSGSKTKIEQIEIVLGNAKPFLYDFF